MAWRRAHLQALTSVVAVPPEDRLAVRGYLELRAAEGVRVEIEPFSSAEALTTWAREDRRDFFACIEESSITSALPRERGQILVLSASAADDMAAPSIAHLQTAMTATTEVPWIPDYVPVDVAARVLVRIAHPDGNASGSEVAAARDLAALVDARSVGLVPLGRMLRAGSRPDSMSRLRDDLDKMLERRFFTSVEAELEGHRRQLDTAGQLGLCAVMIRATYSATDKKRTLAALATWLDLICCCEKRAIPVWLAERMHQLRDEGHGADDISEMAGYLVEVGLAAYDREELSVAGAHQAAMRKINAPRFEVAAANSIDVLSAELDRALRSGGDERERRTLVAHAMAACEAVTAARVTTVPAGKLMSLALGTFGSVAWTGTDRRNMTDWGSDLAERFLVEAREAHGSRSHEFALAARNASWTRRNHGRLTEARDLIAQARVAAVCVPDEIERQKLVAQLTYLEGTILYSDGHVGDAYDALKRVERDLRADEASPRPIGLLAAHDAVHLKTNLARIELSMGELMTARNRLMSLESENLDGDPAVLARIRQNLGLVRLSLGDTAKARDVLDQVFRWREKHLKPDHPDTLQTRNSLARVTLLEGHAMKAAKEATKVARDRARVLGPTNPATMSSLLLALRARMIAGEPVSRDARSHWAARREVFGPNHPATLLACRLLAESLMLEGHPEEALEELKEVRDARAEAPGEPAVEVDPFEEIELRYLEIRATAERAGTPSAWNDAVTGLRAAVSDLESRVGAVHPLTLQLRTAVAVALVGARRWDDASAHLEALTEDIARVGDTNRLGDPARELQAFAEVRRDPERARSLVGSLMREQDRRSGDESKLSWRETDLRLIDMLAIASGDRDERAQVALAAAGSASQVLRARYSHEPSSSDELDRDERIRVERILEELQELDVRESSWPETFSALGRRKRPARAVDPFSAKTSNPTGPRLILQLLVDDLGLSVQRLAEETGISKGRVSQLLTELEVRALVRRGRSRAEVDGFGLFERLATVWRSKKLAGSPGGSPVYIATAPSEWTLTDGLSVQDWCLSGDRAAVALGAPIALTELAPFELLVAAGTSRRSRSAEDQVAIAETRFGRGTERAATQLRLPLVPVPTIEHRVEGWVGRVAHPVAVALDLASSGARGREALQDFSPEIQGRTWRYW